MLCGVGIGTVTPPEIVVANRLGRGCTIGVVHDESIIKTIPRFWLNEIILNSRRLAKVVGDAPMFIIASGGVHEAFSTHYHNRFASTRDFRWRNEDHRRGEEGWSH